MCLGFCVNLCSEFAVTTEHLGDVTNIDAGDERAEIAHASIDELARRIFRDAECVHEMMYGASHLAFKDLNGMPIPLNDQIHAHEA